MSNELNTQKQRADALLRDARIQDAFTIYREICNHSPEDTHAWQMAGAIAGMLGNFEDSVYCCEQAIRLKPSSAVYANYGRALMELKRYTDALDAFTHAIELNHADAGCLNNMGTLYKILENDEKAEDCFRSAISVTPTLFEARLNLATVLNETGRPIEAVSLCQDILSNSHKNFGAFSLLCDCIMNQEAFNSALSCLSANAKHFRQSVDYFHIIIMKLFKQERMDEAGSVIKAALPIFPENRALRTLHTSHRVITGSADEAVITKHGELPYSNLMVIANIGIKSGKYRLADNFLSQASEQNPDKPGPRILLSRVAAIQGRPEDAIKLLEAALEECPGTGELLVELGHIYSQSGEKARAMDYCKQAVAVNPADAAAHDCLGAIHQQNHNYMDAMKCYLEALRLAPDSHTIRCNLASLYCDLGKHPDALVCYDHILEKVPDFENALTGKAVTLERMGQCKPAYETVARLIAAGSRNPRTLFAYARVSHEAGKESAAAELLEGIVNDTGLSLQNRMQVYFSLGKLHDRLRNYDKAFHYYKSGNNLSRDGFDRETHRQFADKIIAAFTADAMDTLPRSAGSYPVPLFIVGMPRSGTTLVEQILSAHPAVYGAGELSLIRNIASSIKSATGTDQSFPLNLNALSAQLLDHFSGLYLKEVKSKSQGEPLLTDKMPSNFMFLGLIELLFPDSKIIHCVRNPLDTGLSCYFQQFKGSQFFSHDLSDIAFYYNTYRSMMRHWKSVLKLPMLDVVYEETVSDQETVSRKIIEFAGLDWHPGCLDFHKTGRLIKTASYDQVRKPMYQSSVGRWKNYQEHLGKLYNNLEHN